MHHAYHTQSIAFRYLLPYCARTGYATEGALFSGVTNSGTVWKKVPESDASECDKQGACVFSCNLPLAFLAE